MPASSKAGLDREEGLFDRVEVWGIGREENKFAQRLVFNQSPDFLGMVDTTVVKDEYTPRAWVRIGERNDKFPEELKKAVGCNGTRDDVVGDDSIDGEDGKDGIPLTPDKIPVLNTALPHRSPAFRSSRCAAIASSLINKHEHAGMGDDVCNVVHICSPEYFITFLSSY